MQRFIATPLSRERKISLYERINLNLVDIFRFVTLFTSQVYIFTIVYFVEHFDIKTKIRTISFMAANLLLIPTINCVTSQIERYQRYQQ